MPDWPFATPQPIDRSLLRAMEEHPDRIAIQQGARTLTYAQMYAGAAAVAQALRDDTAPVLLVLDNCVEFPTAYFGIASARRTIVPVNPLLTGHEVEFIARDTGANTIITTEALWQGIASTLVEAGVERQIFVDHTDGAHAFPAPGEAARLEPIPLDGTGDALAIMYTSGTTGHPKGAVLTHHNLMSVILSSNDAYGTNSEDIFLCMMPMWHVYAATDCMLLPFHLGATVVSTLAREPSAILELVSQHKVTIFPTIPSMFQTMLDGPGYDLSHLKICMSAGTALPEHVLRECEKRYQAPILESYGLTEAAATVTMNPVDGERRVGSVGLPIRGIEVSIVGEDDQGLPPGEIGELRVRGPTVMREYHNNPQATAETIRDGWLYTGDLARADEDGYISIVDRKKDMITHQGLHVFPREVEEVIQAFDGVSEVAVVGLGGDNVDDIYAVLTETSPGAVRIDGLRDYCRERLASFKLPTRYEIAESIPRTASGKIAKRLIRERLSASGA